MCKSVNSFKTFKALTPGLRQTRLLSRHDLLQIKPLKSLRAKYAYNYGRNHKGVITVKAKGGGHKTLYRKLDYDTKNSQGIVEGLEYDPNRNPWIIRLFNPDSMAHSYRLGVKDIQSGDVIRSFYEKKIQDGNTLSLKDLPSGFVIHNLSENFHKKGQYLRAAGTFGQLVLKTSKYAQIKLKSGEHRLFSLQAKACLGTVINENWRFTNIGKAGRNRWYGKKPKVRGVAMNPVDHPHGGGEGKTSGGRFSVTPWGKPTKGQPTAKYINPLRLTYRKIK
jgi:large subunit ribosomal protein L2